MLKIAYARGREQQRDRREQRGDKAGGAEQHDRDQDLRAAAFEGSISVPKICLAALPGRAGHAGDVSHLADQRDQRENHRNDGGENRHQFLGHRRSRVVSRNASDRRRAGDRENRETESETDRTQHDSRHRRSSGYERAARNARANVFSRSRTLCVIARVPPRRWSGTSRREAARRPARARCVRSPKR